ncbi:MAG: hypothetical protein ACR2PI_22240 [Hyphomicrobiaceae bacterium]
MDLNLILETIHSMPTASVALVVVMAISAAVLVSQILKVGYYGTIVSFPVLLLAGLLGNVVMMLNNVMLSPDKASNTALSASFGFILCATMCFAALRVWNQIRDRR